MAKFNIPENNRFSQPNKGELGNIQMSYGVDLSYSPTKIRNSYGMANLLDTADDSDFASKINAFAGGNSATYRYFAIGDTKSFYSAVDDPSTGWVENAGSNAPTLSVRSDMEFFGGDSGLFFVSGDSTGTIFQMGGADGNSADWWVTTKSQTALNTNYYTPLRLGPNNRLYIVDAQKKVYYCQDDTNGAITKTGNGTLDLTYNNLRIITLEPSSTRMWLGCYSVVDGSGGVIEWDMSSNSATFNRAHKLPSPAISIAIWNDVPYAVCMNGEIHRFNGTNFEFYTQFPVPDGFIGFAGSGSVKRYADPTSFSLMHPRGWAIIDGMPHFLINNQALNTTALTGSKNGYWRQPSGVWCLDPNVGLYCRFPLERDAGAGNSFGSQSVKAVGALYALNTTKAKFLAGVQFYTDSSGTASAVLLKADPARTYATRARVAIQPLGSTKKQMWQTVEALYKKLGNSSDRILLKYRLNADENLPDASDVTWVSTTSFTTTDADYANVSVGDEVLVLIGNGAGCSAHISDISESGGTYTVTLNDTIVGVSASDTGTVRTDNWKLLATISAQNTDYEEFSIPDAQTSRKFELMAELRASAGSTVEIDNLAVTSKDV